MQTVVKDISEIENDFLFELCSMILKYGEPQRVMRILETVADSCTSEEFKVNNQKIC